MTCGFCGYSWLKPRSCFTLQRMDSLAPSAPTTPTWSSRLPGWALSRDRNATESDAAFTAGIALKSLDDLIRANPPRVGWRDRLALKSASGVARMLGPSPEETAICDALPLTVDGDDPGPAGKLFLATRMLTRRSGTIATPLVKELCALLGIRGDDALASVPDLIDSAIQSGRAAPFVAADLIPVICAARPDTKVLALGLADVVMAHKLKWPRPVPLLLPERLAQPSAPSTAQAASGRANRLMQKRSAWRWSMALTPHFALPPRSTVWLLGWWPWHQNWHQGCRAGHPQIADRRRRVGAGARQQLIPLGGEPPVRAARRL